ncbi:hypothetical protein ATO13_02835 [Stappia sp. 22II-S9-Z10]|nr:hypothetical protein ATO13_02835 [Stappia sp. 22II-S9-Z10]
MATVTAFEQYLVELINRARSDPAGEAARYGISLNDGLPAGTLSPTPLAPLAVMPTLSDSADAHSADMLANSYFSHTGLNGSSATERMLAAGWAPEPGVGWATGENISYRSKYPATVSQATIDSHHEGLFRSSGHRTNILSDLFSELGVGQAIGAYGTNGYESYVTQNFAEGGRTYITGVALDDADDDGFYDVGEGLGGVTVAYSGDGGSGTAVTFAGGGYAFEVAPGTYEVTFSGPGLDGTVTRSVTVGSDNVKLDAFADDAVSSGGGGGTTDPEPEPEPEPDVVVVEARLAGNRDPNRLVGEGTNDEIVGGGGNDTLIGNGGRDLMNGGPGDDRINGGAAADTLQGAGGADTLNGSTGADELYGGGANDFLVGDNGGDSLYGGGGADRLNGNNGHDRLFGQNGADALYGGGGIDTLSGGGGNDFMDGGGGADLYMFDGGVDTIRITGADRIDLGRFDFTDFDTDIAPNLTNRANGTTYLDLPGQHAIIFETIPKGGFDAGDFIL